jgi:hypothetical protein
LGERIWNKQEKLIMRFLIATLALVATLTLAPAAFAEGDGFPDDVEGVDGTAQALLGLNGMVTSPGDVLVNTFMGDNRFDLPGFTSNVATEFVYDRVVGLGTGAFMTVYRATTGLGDVLMAVFPVRNFSPEPRFVLIDGASPAVAPPAGFPGS